MPLPCPRPEPVQSYGVDLLYREPPELDRADLLARLGLSCPGAVLLPSRSEAGLFAIVHTRHTSEHQGWAVPAQCVVDAGHDAVQPDDEALGQPTQWAAAGETVARCRYRLGLIDLHAAGLPPRLRLELFQTVLAALLEMAPCSAIHWRPAGYYLEPLAFLEGVALHGPGDPWTAAVRLHCSRLDADLLAETVGLAPFGLPEVRCRVRTEDVEHGYRSVRATVDRLMARQALAEAYPLQRVDHSPYQFRSSGSHPKG